jgi:hypothetical protein
MCSNQGFFEVVWSQASVLSCVQALVLNAELGPNTRAETSRACGVSLIAQTADYKSRILIELARAFLAERGLPTIRPELQYNVVGQGRHCPCEVPAPPHAGFLFGVHAFKSDGRNAPSPSWLTQAIQAFRIQELVEKLDKLRRRHIELANQREELRRQCDEIVAQRDEIAEQLQWAREQENLSGMRRLPK